MTEIKNRIKWKVVDKILEETESTPQQLLEWLEWGFENIESHCHNYICVKKLYLDKYFLDTAEFKGYRDNSEKRIYIYLPRILTREDRWGEEFTPATTWTNLRDNLEFRNEMVRRFKKHYKLK